MKSVDVNPIVTVHISRAKTVQNRSDVGKNVAIAAAATAATVGTAKAAQKFKSVESVLKYPVTLYNQVKKFVTPEKFPEVISKRLSGAVKVGDTIKDTYVKVAKFVKNLPAPAKVVVAGIMGLATVKTIADIGANNREANIAKGIAKELVLDLN